MKSVFAICLLLTVGCTAPREAIRVIPVTITDSIHTTVCPGRQVALFAVGHPDEPIMHWVTIIHPDGTQENLLEECDH
ncbi:MAG: hypothetical protein K5880_13800 [Hydrogenophaga sp.]|uniref:hypothetical protein n=1 Tax=Hydrogenophaga sp. TaxID=1904254 RepID=UPI0026278E14|nr:hypothetical protein [Hydrogenophaga sp.]MCV0439695.1 hypothetical protein [Hydrogenophaga sp.]